MTNKPANTSEHPTDDAAVKPAKPFLGRTRKALRWASGYDNYKKRAAFLKERASFPILRAVIRKEREANRQTFDLSTIPDNIVAKSILSHTLMLVIAIPALLWSLLTLTKGLALAFRYDMIFNNYLLFSVPLVITLGCRAHISLHARGLLKDEFNKRQRGHA